MTTETTPAAAAAASSNLNVRQLAATLAKKAPASGETTTTTAKSEPAASAATAPKAKPESHEPPEQTDGTKSLKSVEGGEGTEATEAEETHAAETTETTETQEGTESTESPDAQTEEGEPEAEAGSELPAEVQEAMEIAKAQDGGKGKAEMLKRIHKLTDARDTERNARLQAEEQNKQLRQELQDAQKKAGAPQNGSAPQGVHPEVAKVQAELNNVDQWLGWCEEQLPRLQAGEVESVEIPDGKGGKLQATLKDVARTRRELENIRQEVVARKVQTEQSVKAAFQEAYTKSHQTALTHYPWLKQETSPEYQNFQQVLKIAPWFKEMADHELAIGDFLAGRAAREARAKAPAATATRKAAPSREPTKVATTAPGGGADMEEEPAKKVKQSNQQFAKSGSVRDLARALTANRQASRMTTKR